MKITGVRVTAIAIPRRSVLTTSYGSRGDARTVLVEIDTDEGLVGLGQAVVEAPFYGETAEGIVTNVRTHLVPALIGETPTNIERLNRKLHAALPDHPSSQSAVELALWDLKGKALGVPVYELLGGRFRDGIDLMGAVDRSTPDEMASEAREMLDRLPYPVLKIKIGVDQAEDLALYRAVADSVDGRALLQVDGNAGYTIAQAVPALTAMERHGGLGMIEQPVARLDDLAELARRIPAPVMADESISSPDDAVDIVRRRAASAGFLKITKVGGLLNAWKIAAIFESAGLILSVGIYYDILAAAAAHFAAATPCLRWPSAFTELEDSLLKEPVVPDGLLLPAPDRPGLGVELDGEKVRRYALDL